MKVIANEGRWRKVGCDPTGWGWSSAGVAEFRGPEVQLQDGRDRGAMTVAGGRYFH